MTFLLLRTWRLGIKSLMYSANIAMEEEQEEIPTKAIWGMLASAALITYISTVMMIFKLGPITGPVTSLSPPSLQFGEQLLGTTSAPQPVALANTGAAPLMLAHDDLHPLLPQKI